MFRPEFALLTKSSLPCSNIQWIPLFTIRMYAERLLTLMQLQIGHGAIFIKETQNIANKHGIMNNQLYCFLMT